MAPPVGIEARIFRALTDHLDVWVAANPIAIALPGYDFDPKQHGHKYLRPTILPAGAVPFTLSHSNEYPGIWQIDLFWPSGKGLQAPMELASSIAAHYRVNRIFGSAVTLEVNRPSYLARPLQEPGQIQIPVTVPFRAFVRS